MVWLTAKRGKTALRDDPSAPMLDVLPEHATWFDRLRDRDFSEHDPDIEVVRARPPKKSQPRLVPIKRLKVEPALGVQDDPSGGGEDKDPGEGAGGETQPPPAP